MNNRFFRMIWVAPFLMIGLRSWSQQLIEAKQLQHYTAEQINLLVQLTGESLEVPYGVTSYAVKYTTVTAQGMPDTASGFMALPEAGDLPFPVLFYQHGTANSRNEVPSRNSQEAFLATIAAGLGYITLAADYQGLGDSRGLHPYLHAESEAKYAIDLFVSLLPFMEQQSVIANKQVFVTGYSQGGHAAMALHRALQQNPLPESFEVAAAAPMSGPYSVSEEMLGRVKNPMRYNYPGYAIYTLLSYNSIYHLYDSLSQVIKAPYIAATNAFLREEISVTELHQQLLSTLEAQTGTAVTADLFQDSIIAGLSDPNNAFLMALKENDTYDWAPQEPTRLVYCMNDDQVVYTNAVRADSVMNANGAPDVVAVDVFPEGDHGTCVLPAVIFTLNFFEQFRNTSSRRETFWAEGSIYPNPANRQITLTSLPFPGEVRLINGLGQEVMRHTITQPELQLNLPALSNGTYALIVSNLHATTFRKLMVLQQP